MANTIVDARGEQCPIPVVRANKALAEMTSGTLEVHVDNEIAVQNVLRMAQSKNLSAADSKIEDKHFVIAITVSGSTAEDSGEAPACTLMPTGDTVVVIDTNVMGRGSDELGQTLLKGFVFALSQLPKLPDTILLYNGGVTLAVEGSDSLQDLQEMEKQGVEIFACGTCLNYYGLTDKLAVGSVTNMYSIVEKLDAAAKVIKP